MNTQQDDYFVKDITVLNERPVPTPIQTVTLFVGDAKPSELTIKNPYMMDKLVTFLVQDSLAARPRHIQPFNSLRNIISGIKNKLLHLYYSLVPAEKFEAPVFDIRSIEPNNIAHLTIHAIPLCLLVKSLAGANTQFLFGKINPPFKKLLDAFDIQAQFTNKKIQAEFVKVYATRGLSGHNILDAHECLHSSVLPNTYDQYQFKSPLANKKKIFIARRGTRGLINHDVTHQLLSQHGYETVFMEDYSITEQLGIASEATHVVAVHGASMGMLVLNKNIQSLIEILPPNVYHEYFAICLADCVKKHIQIIPSFDDRVLFNGWDAIAHFKNKPFSVDQNQLQSALALI